MLNIRKFFNGLNIVPRSDGATAPIVQGDLAVSSVDGNLYYNNGTSTSSIISDSSTSVLTNKTIDATLNTILNISDTNIATSAAISFSKLASLTSGNILVGSAGNVASSVTMSGDILISNTGVTSYNGIVPITKGGTGQSSANSGLNALLPSQTSNSGKFLTTDGTNTSWGSVSGGSGTVTSVALTAPGIFTVSGSPVTTSGTLDFSLNSQSQNLVLASPNGSSGTPSFRAIVSSDISGAISPANGGTGIVNNAASTITISGNFATTFTVSAVTSITLPISGTLSTLAGTETLTNKTFGDAITFSQITTPSTPAATKNKLYFKSDDNLYKLNSSGVEQIIGSTGGSGNFAVSSSYTNASATGTGPLPITAVLTTSGRPVMLMIQATNNTTNSSVTITNNVAMSGVIQFTRDGTVMGAYNYAFSPPVGGTYTIPTSAFQTLDYTVSGTPGTYTYGVSQSTVDFLGYQNIVLVAYEV